LDAVVTLSVVVTLTVGAAAKAGLGEDFLVEFATLAQFNLRLKDIDFASQFGLGALGKPILPARGHGTSSYNPYLSSRDRSARLFWASQTGSVSQICVILSRYLRLNLKPHITQCISTTYRDASAIARSCLSRLVYSVFMATRI